jgi:hypothetical protein
MSGFCAQRCEKERRMQGKQSEEKKQAEPTQSKIVRNHCCAVQALAFVKPNSGLSTILRTPMFEEKKGEHILRKMKGKSKREPNNWKSSTPHPHKES